jgi:phosphate transport system protein
MESKKNKALQQIHDHVIEMSELVLGQLRQLDNILSSGTIWIDKNNLDELREVERKIDKFEITIDGEFIDIICLHNPVASELRKIIACYRISINLERIGDMCINIFNTLSDIKQNSHMSVFVEEMAHMQNMTNNMVERSLLSFFNKDIDYAIWTLKNDDVIDDINNKMLKKIIKKNPGQFKDAQAIRNFFHLKSIVSSIERIADHATNIAEASIYYLKGEDIRHSRIN